MKKIIRLTENDLTNLVKKVIKENHMDKVNEYLNSDKFQEYVEVMTADIYQMYETSLKKDLKNIGVDSEHLNKMYYYTLAVLFKETLNKLTSFE